MSVASGVRGAANEQDADYNSSDVEYEEPDAEFQRTGHKSITAMLEAPFSRNNSKKWFKELTQGGKWHERYVCWLWWNRLTAYREQLLMKPKGSMPTVEDLIRFIVHFASTRSGRGTGGVMNYETMRHGLNYMNKTLIFKYEAWNIGAHGASQLQGAMDKLLREGHLTREMTRSREPAGAVVVRRLIKALYQDAITTGTSSWNMLLNDIAIIVLTSCFQCRGGDLLGDTSKSKDKRHDLPGLRYSDIQLVVGKGGDIGDIMSKDKMRNTKGTKDDEKLFFYLFRNALPDGADNVMCAIKMILILALRSGNTHGTSVERVLSIARARPDRTIQWRYPNRPVLCAAASMGIPDYDKLALRQRGNRVLIKANSILGSSVSMSMHALRFGDAADLMAIQPTPNTGFSMDRLANELGHTPTARIKNVGLIYAQSYSTEDAWQQRVKLTAEETPFSKYIAATDEAVLPPQVTSLAALKRKRTSKEVKQDCEARGLDPNKRTNRMYHSRRAPGEPAPVIDPNLDEWQPGDEIVQRVSETRSPKDPTSVVKSAQTPARQPAQNTYVALGQQLSTGQTEAARANLLQLLAQLDDAPQVLDDTENLDLVPVGGQVLDTSFQHEGEDAEREEDTRLDEYEPSNESDALLDSALFLSDLGQHGAIPDDTHNEAISALLCDDEAFGCTGDTNSEERLTASLTGDPAEFVRFMAAVNILRLSSTASKQWKAAQAAGSDVSTSISVPIRFKLSCINAINGCTYASTETDLLELHLCTCKYNEPPEDDTQKKKKPTKAAKSKADKQWKCDVVGCSKEYVNKGDLTAHGKEDHDEVGCFISDCDNDAVYNGEKALFRNHMKDAHPALGVQHPQVQDQYIATFRCGIEGCECETDFRFFISKSWACLSYLRHLQTAHNIVDVQERKKLVPTFPGNPCAFPGCTTEELFGVGKRGASDYDTHILMAHKVLKPEDRFEYTWQRVHGQVMPMRPE